MNLPMNPWLSQQTQPTTEFIHLTVKSCQVRSSSNRYFPQISALESVLYAQMPSPRENRSQ